MGIIDRLLGRDEDTSTSGAAMTGGRDPRLALVYRGKATLPGCPEAVGAALEQAGMTVAYVGPREKRHLNAETLAEAAIYAQPGGGDLDDAWPRLQDSTEDIQTFVRDGGSYLGFCLGAYLAGDDPGFDLLPGRVDQYVVSKGASITHERDALITLDWDGAARTMYFQDGAIMYPGALAGAGAGAQVVAHYDNGGVAAMVSSYGSGRVGVVGPHPEASLDWYVDVGLTPPQPLAVDLAVDLVQRVRVAS